MSVDGFDKRSTAFHRFSCAKAMDWYVLTIGVARSSMFLFFLFIEQNGDWLVFERGQFSRDL